MKKIFLFISLVFLLGFQLKAQKDKVLLEHVNEAVEIPVYFLYQEIGLENIDVQGIQVASHVQFTPDEISAANHIVKNMAFPEGFKLIEDSIVGIMNQRFETNKFVKSGLKKEYFNALGQVKWDFEKSPLFVFVTIDGRYELGGLDGASRKDDVEKSLTIKWKLCSIAKIAFSHVNENGDYRVYSNYAAVHYGPAVPVKNVQYKVENIAMSYDPILSIGPFSRKIDFFTNRFMEKQKKDLAKKKK